MFGLLPQAQQRVAVKRLRNLRQLVSTKMAARVDRAAAWHGLVVIYS
jgi:hypothetical protein